MKKLSSVALSLVLATAMMGAGYAAWQSQITVSNAVQTGTFGFKIVHTDDSKPSVTLLNDSYIGAGTNDVTSVSDGAGTITLNNLYPGVVATVDFPISNSSSIPAMMSSYKLTGLPTGLTAKTYEVVDGVATEITADSVQIDPTTTDFTLEYVITAEDSLSESGSSYTTTIQPTFDQKAEPAQ